ncbi:MAG: hypothetical protein QM769_08390 [Pseudoxanthomonas sp.]
MNIKRIALASLLAASGTAIAGNTPDASVGKKLDAIGLKYNVDEDGDYRLVMSGLEGDRTQLVIVRSSVETLGNYRIREVWAAAGKLPAAEDAKGIASIAAISKGALMDANDKKLGGWVLKGKEADETLYYVAQIPADMGSDDLETVIASVAKSADTLEQSVEGINGTPKDKY